jgi:hypothetical protein
MDTEIQHKAIWDYQKAIIEIYKEQQMKSLSGIDKNYVVNDRQIVAWFYDIVRKGEKKFPDVNFHKLFDDLIFCSDEILHFTAQLFLYAPFMNNPLHDGHWFYDRMVYPNIQNLEAKRFSMFANTVSEKVYNYWDRIGDLIASYFPDKIDPKRVFFPTAIEIIPEKYHNSENYKWLLNFKESEYKTVNNKRKEIVHYLTHDTDFRHKHLSNSSSEEELVILLAERDELPNFYKSHINTTLDGFEKTMLLIEEITAEDLNDIE